MVAHLGDHAVLLFGLHQQICLEVGVSQGFLNVDVLAQSHSHHGRGEMGVVGSDHGNSVYILVHFLQHDAEICKLLRIRRSVEILLDTGALEIHVAPCCDLRLAVAADSGDYTVGPASTSNNT